LLLQTFWASNQSQMAREVGASQSLINKIIRGERVPGRKFLEKLARMPRINPDWVLHGRGQPLPLSTRGTLPVATGILPYSPGRSPELLSGRHPVAAEWESESRYWLQVHEQSPLVQVNAWAILPGDLLLLDHSADWTARLDMALGRLCAVRLER